LVPNFETANFNNRQTVWIGGLGLAFEQIYVVTNSLSLESKRVWRVYLKNQLNKPTIRAAFVADASSALDDHQEFWRFVRGTPRMRGGNIHYENHCIHPKYFSPPASPSSSKPSVNMSCSPASMEDMPFWLEIYGDGEVRKQMYSAPINSPGELWNYLLNRKVFTAWIDGLRVGGFTISAEKDLLATFGLVLHPSHRERGYGSNLLELLESEAKKLGIKTLRADIYEDNYPCIKLLNRDGFRRFIWMEKNI
jgi:GNAT superfamily N-acetyltransferase